jgi:hypothetical protein
MTRIIMTMRQRYQASVRREKERLLPQTLEEQVKDTNVRTTPAKLTLEILTVWLKPDLSYLDYHLSVRGKKIHSKAGRWVFGNNHFGEWREQMGSRFWLHEKGNILSWPCSYLLSMRLQFTTVGSGKTILW